MMSLSAGDFIVADLEYPPWEGAHARNCGGPGEFREGLDGFAEFVGALPILTHGRDDVAIVE